MFGVLSIELPRWKVQDLLKLENLDKKLNMMIHQIFILFSNIISLSELQELEGVGEL